MFLGPNTPLADEPPAPAETDAALLMFSEAPCAGSSARAAMPMPKNRTDATTTHPFERETLTSFSFGLEQATQAYYTFLCYPDNILGGINIEYC
jgi:hypothetical protein